MHLVPYMHFVSSLLLLGVYWSFLNRMLFVVMVLVDGTSTYYVTFPFCQSKNIL